ncbi:MAG: methionyl-tRNA formyltransferase [Gammaproteobacteria bacterium]|nr:methionyl-tRNA formyltransferase [Gammaproteobacteria bacterium]
MKIIFAGTPDIAIAPLEALLASRHTVIAVYTQPDRPAGRGKKLTASPVKEYALRHGLTIEQPENFKTQEALDRLHDYHADIMVVMAYGLLLPSTVLTTPRHGCINIHVSLLPRWRGAAPVHHAILAGDENTGVTIMQMDKGLDTGPLFAQESCAIDSNDTSEMLYSKLALIGPPLLLKVLNRIDEGNITPQPQNTEFATYAHKIQKSDARIDWNETTVSIDRKVRAYYPAPIAFFEWQGQLLRIWAGHPVTLARPHHTCGEVLNVSKNGITFATSDGAYCITCLQFPHKKPLSGHELANAWKNHQCCSIFLL